MADTPLPGLDSPPPPIHPDPATEAGRELARRLLDVVDDADRDARAFGAVLQLLQGCGDEVLINAGCLAVLLDPWVTSVETRAADLAAMAAVRPSSYAASAG